ncbi:MAG: hypothetical protein ACYTGN_07965 [Planctomycetota bacterium]|jgi:hypothetical protein
MKYFSILVLACLFVGCGGGGSDPAPVDPGNGNGNGGGEETANFVLTRDILQQCAAAELGGLLDVATQIADLAAGTLTGVMLQGVDDTAKQIQLMIDTTGDGQPELQGGIQFLDSAGTPANVDLSGIQADNNLSKLPDVLATMPDGGVVTVSLQAMDGSSMAEFQVGFQNGLPLTINGSVTFSGTTCQSNFTLEDVSALGLLLGTIPTATIGFTLSPVGSSDSVEGDAIYNGTDTVRIEAKVGGTDEVNVFNMSIDTGAITKA